jgi:hypothetical protein
MICGLLSFRILIFGGKTHRDRSARENLYWEEALDLCEAKGDLLNYGKMKNKIVKIAL